ncbi:universal stress protein [Azomonas macrocytogenes]|uniref:Nucleotide-binding universal stress UspA family protein n=1 Tax=Azomonas macrocytogenes TaxID=69962 RepID=A0A839T047_AZOMA|nr:universal stress protein [Azomonas macrocytogenes]MBB3102349.1 nucleotide-binding universal stress UspA family protein [Azomonas macrocytogenes]
MSRVLACIDGSQASRGICDGAAWASQRLNAPLLLLHILERKQHLDGNLSGSIGIGSREHLLAQLVALDEKHNRLALEQGCQILETARQRAQACGAVSVENRQRHGNLLQTINELQEQSLMLVLGKQGEDSEAMGQPIGSQLEPIIRASSRPLLITPPLFKAPRQAMIAFDGSETLCRNLGKPALPDLLRGLPVHLVLVGNASTELKKRLEWACALLLERGLEAKAVICPGEVEQTLLAYQTENRLDLVVMGAYGRSWIRHFLVGSITTNMLQHFETPLLLLR